MIADRATLERLIGVVEMLIAALPPIVQGEMGSYQARRRAGDAALERLVAEEGARVSSRSTDLALRMAGIRATCTHGHKGLLVNWAASARRRIAQGERT